MANELEDVADAFQDISGVKDSSVITVDGEQYVQVHWFGNPSNYNTRVSQIRSDYPDLKQVEAPSQKPKKDADQMPIAYYQF